MNSLVKSQLEHLGNALQELADVMAMARSRTKLVENDKDRILQENWAAVRQAKIMKETMDRLTDVLDENERLNLKQSAAREHVLQLLEYARALGDEMEK